MMLQLEITTLSTAMKSYRVCCENLKCHFEQMWGETWQDELLVVLLSRCTRSLHDGRAIKMSGIDWIVNFILYC